MKDVFAFFFQIFQYHETATIIFFVGIAGLLFFAFVKEISSALAARRARRSRKEGPTPKFGPNSSPPGRWNDEIAQRDRDLEKWRKEHKAHLEQ
jgi:hypothetical protein